MFRSIATMHKRIDEEQSATARWPLLDELELALLVSEQAEKNAMIMNNGETWYRAWKRSLELAEQIAIVKELQHIN